MMDIFYLVNVYDTNLLLGVQWFYYIGEHTINDKVPKMIFQDVDGKEVVSRDINTYPK